MIFKKEYKKMKVVLNSDTQSKKTKSDTRGVMPKALDFGIVGREFKLQSHYYVYFWTITLEKGMDSLILPSMR